GLEPLADRLWQHADLDPEQAALAYIDADKGIADSKAALDGARAIIMERIAEDADLLAKLRDYLTRHAEIVSQVIAGKEQAGEKFKDYFDHRELIAKT
ncbi:Tex-like N-terminal domain-containing protein, partial [Vibrio cholerae]